MTTTQNTSAPTPATQYLAVDGGRIAYDIQGAGALVLLVPGMGDLRATYRFLTPVLVAAGYRVATVDLRGHGESDASFRSYGDVETAGDLTALLTQFGEPAVIVGNSMAAGAAVIVAASSPALVSGLVLVGPFVRQPASSAFLLAAFRLMMTRPWATAVWKAYLPSLYAGAKPQDFTAYRDSVIASLKRPGYARSFSLTTRTEHVRAGESLAAVTAPTLVVMGDKDPDFKNPAAEAEWIAGTLNGTVVVVPEAGHYPQSQQPEITSRAIVEFLGSLGTSDARGPVGTPENRA